jgi:uncharacterized membrane protein
MKSFLMTFFIALPIFLVIDAIWLSTIGRSFYVPELGAILRPRPVWAAAALFYAVFVVGLILFVINPAVAAGSVGQAILMGAAFGFVAYATYDLTSYATIQNYPLSVAIVDMIWGSVLAALVSGSTVWVVQRLNI